MRACGEGGGGGETVEEGVLSSLPSFMFSQFRSPKRFLP